MRSWKTGWVRPCPILFVGGDPGKVRTSLEHQPESNRLGLEPTVSFGEFSVSGLNFLIYEMNDKT